MSTLEIEFNALKIKCAEQQTRIKTLENEITFFGSSVRAQAKREAFEEAANAAASATLPSNFQWGPSAMEQFNYGKRRCVEAIRALSSAPPPATAQPRSDEIVSGEMVIQAACAYDEARRVHGHLTSMRQALSAVLTTPSPKPEDEPCCHRIVALMDRCKGLVAEVAAAREEIGRKDAVIETYKQGINELLHPIIVERNAEILALRAQLSIHEPSAVTVTDEMVERALAAWYPGEWPHDPAFSSTVGNELFADHCRKEMRDALIAALAKEGK